MTEKKESDLLGVVYQKRMAMAKSVLSFYCAFKSLLL